jgi:HTH-type transcriptional regulator/antitoxin HigA
MTALMQPLSDLVTIRLIKTEADYEAALAELDGMIGRVESDTPDGNRYELLASLVEAYEEENYPIEASNDPIVMIEFVLDARGLTRKDLEPFIGTRQRVWDIMEKRRRLTLPMIRRLSKGLHIPVDVLVQEYALQRNSPAFQPRSTVRRQHSARPLVVQP